MKKYFWIFILVFFAGGLFLHWVEAKEDPVTIYFFSSATCPHCAKEREFLNDLEKKYPEVNVVEYEVVYHPENVPILQEYYKKYNVPKNEQGRVPVTFTPTKYFIGFNESIGKGIEGCIRECLGGEKADSQKLKLPIFGEIDLSKVSLPALTIILGTLDGFNPCAMWILLILISLLLPLQSRKKIALVGGTFIFAEGLLYFLFMAAWLNAFLAISYVSLTRILIGVVGIVFGAWRVRDFFTWKPGVCKVTEHTKSQDKILNRIQNVLKPSAVPATVLGIFILAFGVNLIEFFCSAGFPTIYTRILAMQNLNTLQYYLYLVFYNFFYMIDDFIVFGFAFFTLNRFGASDKYNRYSTLIAGVLILLLGILLILKPEFLMFG